MTDFSQVAPELCSIAQCNASLDFQPLHLWPEGLPAVAVNGWVLAGFAQKLVFNHSISFESIEAAGSVAKLFRSLHTELSFAEMARLIQKIQSQKNSDIGWLRLETLLAQYHWICGDQLLETAKALLQTPVGFQNWCAQKKINPQDLAPLLSAENLELKFLFHDILQFNLSKSLGVKALELGIELLLMGQSPEAISSQVLLTFLSQDQVAGEAWVDFLKQLRFPETFKRDQILRNQMKSLPWPGTSQARWSRQGDRGGIELKLFVSQASDLKKALTNLQKVQDLMEKPVVDPSEEPETRH